MSPSTDGLSRSIAVRANRGYAKRSRSHDPSARRHRRMVVSASRPRRAAHALPRKRTRALNASRHSRSECNSKRGARHARPGGMNSRWSGLSVSLCRLRSIALSRSGGMTNPVACSRRSMASHHRPVSWDSSQPPVGSRPWSGSSHRSSERPPNSITGMRFMRVPPRSSVRCRDTAAKPTVGRPLADRCHVSPWLRAQRQAPRPPASAAATRRQCGR